MCNLSYGVDQRGYNRGYNTGYSSGFSEGVDKERIRSAQSLINAKITTIEQLTDSKLYTDEELAAIAAKTNVQ